MKSYLPRHGSAAWRALSCIASINGGDWVASGVIRAELGMARVALCSAIKLGMLRGLVQSRRTGRGAVCEYRLTDAGRDALAVVGEQACLAKTAAPSRLPAPAVAPRWVFDLGGAA